MTPKKTLSSRMFAAIFAFSFVAMLAATVAATAASYSSYESDAEARLLSQAQQCAELLGRQDARDNQATLAGLPLADERVTLIAADGAVLYDNQADASAMENHGQRAEVAQARESGQGVVMRRSETFGVDTLYAAVQLNDGRVLRLAESRASLASFISGAAWQLGISLIIIFVVSFLLSRAVTRRVVRPLEGIDLSHPLDNDAYAEVQPLLSRVDQQRRELEGQNAELQHAVTLRREFTGNVSHEMKTPLQVIGGYAELMEAGMVAPEDVPRTAGLIRVESESIRALIDDVLTLSKLDEKAGTGERVSLREACERAVARLEPVAKVKGVYISLDCDGSCVLGEPAAVEQMVYNLVDNAVKYSPKGGRVGVSCSETGGKARLVVQDQGPGIPDEFRERVFERFFRVDTSRSRETGGTGLGLAIVKHAAESLGGTAHVEDAAGGGSAFVVEAPLA